MWIRQQRTSEAEAQERHAYIPALRTWVAEIARPRHFWAHAAENRRTGDAIAGELGRLGYRVELQGQFRNVVALPRACTGRHAPQRPDCTLVCAHYDSVPGCPGADDNASGVAAMLTVARVLSDRRVANVGFVAFNAEEDGLLGSDDFVSHGLGTLPISLRMVHVLEMCGYRNSASGSQRLPFPSVLFGLDAGTFIAMIGRGRANREVKRALEPTMSSTLHRVGVFTTEATDSLLPDLLRSDHAPFWNAGLPAMLWTDTGNFRNPHYHQPTDTPDTLDYAFMGEVTDLLVRLLCEPAECDRPR